MHVTNIKKKNSEFSGDGTGNSDIMGCKKNISKSISSKFENIITDNPEHIANEFNYLFIRIGN